MVNIKKNQVCSFVPDNTKILDFQTNDTNARVCSLAGILPSNVVAVIIHPRRASGSGAFKVFPNSGAAEVQISTASQCVVGLAEGTLDLKFQEGTANDDWDIYSHGYWIEGPAET